MPAPRRRPEEDGQSRIVQFARLLGFLAYHPYDSRRSEPGFPDIWICGFGTLLILELKAGRNTTSTAQDKWIKELRLAGQDVRVYQVEDWGNLELAEELKLIKRTWSRRKQTGFSLPAVRLRSERYLAHPYATNAMASASDVPALLDHIGELNRQLEATRQLAAGLTTTTKERS